MNIVGSLHKVSDEKLRVKEDKTSWAVRLEGHSVFLPGQWPCAIWSKIMQPVVLLVKACAKRSLSSDLIFGSFHQGKEQSQPVAIERVDVDAGNTAYSKRRTTKVSVHQENDTHLNNQTLPCNSRLILRLIKFFFAFGNYDGSRTITNYVGDSSCFRHKPVYP
jgi:hypothetical protein